MIDYFREKNRFLHRRRDMENFCYEVGNTFEYSNGREYGVRVDTEHYAFHCYCYRKDWLDSHLERAKKGIRFIDSGYNDLFNLPDGGTIQISYLNDKPKQRVCRYIDPCHVEIGNNLYHICEFAERMENIGATYKSVCFNENINPTTYDQIMESAEMNALEQYTEDERFPEWNEEAEYLFRTEYIDKIKPLAEEWEAGIMYHAKLVD